MLQVHKYFMLSMENALSNKFIVSILILHIFMKMTVFIRIHHKYMYILCVKIYNILSFGMEIFYRILN